MKILFILVCLPLLFTSCSSSDESNKALASNDTTEVLRRSKEVDEIFSPFELDSIYKKLKSSPLVAFPKEWEMLTKKNNELIVLIPGGGDNHRFAIIDSDSLFMLRLNGMHDVAEYLITGCEQSVNKTTITYYSTTTWTYGNKFLDVITERAPIYSTLVIESVQARAGQVICNYPKDKTYYVEVGRIKDYPKEIEPSPYDEDVMSQVIDSAVPVEKE